MGDKALVKSSDQIKDTICAKVQSGNSNFLTTPSTVFFKGRYTPDEIKKWYLCKSVCQSVSLSVCQSVSLSVCQSVS